MPQWHREGHYDFIAERLFSQLKHDRILLEYDDERSGSFAPLRYVPRGKIAVLGLVTTKRANLESLELLRRRLGEATQFLPAEQLALSPQCGFGASTASPSPKRISGANSSASSKPPGWCGGKGRNNRRASL